MCQIRILLLALALCLFGAFAQAQQGGDLEAQILYAYQIEDANELASVAQLLTTQEQTGGADATLRYHLAHAEYRLGLLGGQPRGHDAEWEFAACVHELNTLLQQGESVEALALQGACYGNLARYRKIERPLLRARADERLAGAAKLQPHNPRVVYLRALDALSRFKAGSTENQVAFLELQQAAQEFEQASATDADAPAWGHADSFLELGRQFEVHGDVPNARKWIEKSLAVAPHFKAAQRQFAGLARHR